MSFYGIVGLFISSYLWSTILWNVGSDYDQFDRKERIVCIFHWGFRGKNCRVFLRFLMSDVQSIRVELKGKGTIPLTHTDENLTPHEMEQKAAELAYFLHVPIEGFLLKKGWNE